MLRLDKFPDFIDNTLQRIDYLIKSADNLPYIPQVETMKRRLTRSYRNLESILELFPKIVHNADSAALEEGLPPVKPLSKSALNKIRAATEATNSRLRHQAALEHVRREEERQRAIHGMDRGASPVHPHELGALGREEQVLSAGQLNALRKARNIEESMRKLGMKRGGTRRRRR
jgi:hypothetical protein